MPSDRPSSSRRWIRPSTVIGLLFLLLVGLALLAIPFLKAPSHAEDARTDLESARTSLARRSPKSTGTSRRGTRGG